MRETVDRPDLGEALPPELFQQIKAIQIRTQRTVTDLMAGEYESAFKGRGMEFEEVREYRPGDDVRHLDWNVTARMGVPFVKVHREERELTVMLLVDVSASGAFGTRRKLKSEVTAEVAALLAYTAIRSNDRVGLILFSDQVERFIPPKKGRSHVWRVIREILTFRPRHPGTSLVVALEYLARVSPRRVVTFILSDFLDQGFEEALRTLARRHDVTAVPVLDPREVELPRVGILELEDAETGERLLVDTLDRELARRFTREGRRERLRRRDLFRSAGVGEVEVRTDRPYVDALVRFFRAREA